MRFGNILFLLCAVLLLLFAFNPEFRQMVLDKLVPSEKKVTTVKDEVTQNEWNIYKRKVEGKINRLWHAPKMSKSVRATVAFEIMKDGNVENVRLLTSSKDMQFDDAVRRTIKNCAPFDPLPSKYSGKSLQYEYTFVYSVQAY